MLKNVLIAALAVVIVLLCMDRCNKPEERPAEITKKELNQAADSAGVNPQAVKEVIKYQTITRTEIKTVTDTFNRIEYKDRWTEVKGEIKHDTIKLSVTTYDSLTIVQYEKRKNLFSKKKIYIDVFNSNPSVHTDGIRMYQVKQKPKNWSLGVGVSYGWNGKNWQPQVGISLTRTLIRL